MSFPVQNQTLKKKKKKKKKKKSATTATENKISNKAACSGPRKEFDIKWSSTSPMTTPSLDFSLGWRALSVSSLPEAHRRWIIVR